MRLLQADTPAFYVAVLLAVFFALWSESLAAFPAVDADLDAERPIANEIHATLTLLQAAADDKPANLHSLSEIYKRREYRPLWCDAGGVTTAAHYWLSVLSAAEQQGVSSVGEVRLQLEGRLNATRPADIADLDLMLSDSFLQYAGMLANGQFERVDVDPDWQIQSSPIQPVKLIEEIAQSSQPQRVYRSLLPSHPGYEALHSALLRYLWIAESGGWPLIAKRGATLQAGDESDEVLTLRSVLWSMGDLADDALDKRRFDAELQRGVERFQRRHGLLDDGVVGKRTRAALAVSVDTRIEQLRLNLERWRWLPRELGERYIMVNNAAFELTAYEAGRPPLSMRVIVGRQDRQTPVFMEYLRYMIVNPYWHVPGKLARRDLIPQLLDQPDYFFERHIRVLSGWDDGARELDPESIDWQAVLERGYLPYKLRQDPGPRNALGRIKFMLPNRFSVYLHDTPGKHLFERPARMFSSGCVRVERPMELANFALGNDRTPASLAELQTLIEGGDTRTLSLPEPLPVYMVYQTAWVDASGDVQFRDDVYGRDQKLAARLRQKRAQVGSGSVKNTSVARAINQLP